MPLCRTRTVLVAIPFLAFGQFAEPLAHQKLIPTLWVQTSQEWRAAALQAYSAATLQLDRARKDKSWTAAIEQTGQYRKLPPAIILDIDETVLDNSPSQAREVVDGREFTPAEWNHWVSEARADPIPGAADFCRYAASRAVRVFFVTNRDAPYEQATRSNLARHGFPLPEKEDTVLLRGEKPDWSSDKGTRRAYIASRYRILLLIGDDLGDFLSGIRTSPDRRREIAAPHLNRWGRQWIMLSNPGYGSWEESLYGDPRPADAGERLKRKLSSVDARR